MSTCKQPEPAKGLPIDMLLLTTLADERSYSAKQLAELWGEDRQRVYDWLERFRKRGLVVAWAKKCNGRNQPAVIMWTGDRAKILAYVETRKDILA